MEAFNVWDHMHCCGGAVCYPDILGLLWLWVLTVHWKAGRCLIVHMKKEAEEFEAGRAAGNPQAFGLLSERIKSVCHYPCTCVPREREIERDRENVLCRAGVRVCHVEVVAPGFVLTVFGLVSQRLVLWECSAQWFNAGVFKFWMAKAVLKCNGKS